MTIGGLKRGWREGKCNILDDSFEHSVHHNGTQERVILDIVIEHPDHKGTLQLPPQLGSRPAAGRAGAEL